MSPQLSRDANFWILLNEESGNDDKQRTQQAIRRVFEQSGQRHEFVCVRQPRDLISEARVIAARVAAHGGAMIVAGGDGSICAVAGVALDAQCPFGVIPMGTFNYFARANHISEDPVVAAEGLVRSKIEPVQVGLVNEKIFLVNASLGLYPKLFEEREVFQKRLGRGRVVSLGAALVTLLREHRQLSLKVVRDGVTERLRTPTLVVANNRLQLEQIGVGGPELKQGKLVAITLKSGGAGKLLKMSLAAALGRLGQEPEVEAHAIQELIVRPGRRYGSRRLKVAIDGEVRHMKTPLTFRVSKQCLQLLTPISDAVGGDE